MLSAALDFLKHLSGSLKTKIIDTHRAGDFQEISSTVSLVYHISFLIEIITIVIIKHFISKKSAFLDTQSNEQRHVRRKNE